MILNREEMLLLVEKQNLPNLRGRSRINFLKREEVSTIMIKKELMLTLSHHVQILI